MGKWTPLVLAAAVTLTACATASPYQPITDRSAYGYEEQVIEAERYRIRFAGNSSTSLEQVENSLLYRAAELTLQDGFDWFEVVTRGTDAERELVGEPVFHHRYRGFFGYSYFHPRFGWRPGYDPFFDDEVRIREIERFEAQAEIVLGKGEKPEGAAYYDAREVERNLRPGIVRPSR